MIPDLPADLRLATDAIRRAGAAVMRHYGTDMVVQHKGPDQPLTVADLEADAMLRTTLTSARPGYGWLSEETRDNPDRLQRSRVWIVDPIDGTRSFVAGLPEFSLSVGLAVDGAAMLGLVYNPVTDELYYAVRGGGAFQVRRDGPPARLRVGPQAAERPTMLASRSEISAGAFAPFADRFHVEPLGSTAYKLARVAAGLGDVFLSRGPKAEWDVCAGVLLVEEAGGRVTDTAGTRPAFNRPDPGMRGVLAAGARLHDEVLAAVARLPGRKEA